MSEDTPEYTTDPRVSPAERDKEILESRLGLIGHRLDKIEALPPLLPQHDKLFAALAVAQGQITAAVADKQNTHFNFSYADLDACWDACRKPLSDNELSIIQIPSPGEDGTVHMRTILGHSSGQFIDSNYTMLPDKSGPQALGSCMTYLRRYMLCAMVGISQEDDDANMATADPDEYTRISKTQVDDILVLADNLFKKSADAVVERMLAKVFELTSVKDIPADLFEQAKTLLENQSKREKSAAKPKPKDKTDKEKLAELEADKK